MPSDELPPPPKSSKVIRLRPARSRPAKKTVKRAARRPVKRATKRGSKRAGKRRKKARWKQKSSLGRS